MASGTPAAVAEGSPSAAGTKVSQIASRARRWRRDSCIGPDPMLCGRTMAEHRYDPQRSSPAGSRCGPTSARGRSPTTGRPAGERSYVLEMLPYPSGEPHIGHLKVYSVGDAVAHFHRRTGRRVLHPMGYDAFGLPAENHAIKTGQHPRDSTDAVDRRVPAPVPRVGHLDRLDARVRHARAALLPLDAVDLPAALRARPGLPQGGGGQVVPQRPDRARQRAGHRRALRALRRARSRSASSSSGSSASPTTPTACSTTSTTIDWPRARQDDAAQLDRPLGGRRGRRSAARSSASTTRCSRRAPTRCSARRSSSWRPSTPTSCASPRAPSTSSGPRLRQPRAHRVQARSAGTRASTKTGVPLGRTVTNPVNGEADPDVRRRLRADGVRHRRDHGGARATTSATSRSRSAFDLPIRRVIEGARRRGAALHGRRPARQLARRFDGLHNREALRADRRLARPRGQGPRVGQLPPARLAALAPALLGLPDPDRLLREDGIVPVPDDQLPVELPDIEDYAPKGRSPLAAAEDWVNDDLPVVRRPGPARDRHDGHVRRLVLVLPALLRRAQRRGGVGPRRPATSGCRSTSTSAASSTRSCT